MKLLYNNLADTTADGSSLTSDTTADTSYPLANLLNPLRTKVWQSSGAALNNAHYVLFDLGTPQTVNAIALVNTNLLANGGTLAFQGNATSTWGSPSVIISLASANLDVDGDDAYAYFTGGSYRYWRLVFTPQVVPYIGRIFFGPTLTPTDTFKVGYHDETTAVSQALQSLGGQMYVDQRNSHRVFTLEFVGTSDANKYAELGAFANVVGTNQYFVATLDETSSASISNTTIYCKLANFPRWKNLVKTANGYFHSAQIQLTEVP